MEWTMTTRSGDTFDILAWQIYGSEALAYLILGANPAYQDMVYLPAGLTLTIPDTPAQITAQPAPPWAQS